MDWTAPVDIYCERLHAGFWAEPANALTNLAFFAAALIALRAARARGRLDGATLTLIALTFAVGTGSFLFHTFAQRWAGAADVIPILLFILAYFGLAIWRFFGARAAEAAALTLGFLLFASGLRAAAASALPPALSPAIGYLPALVALAACGGLLALRRHPAAGWLLVAAAVFTLSLTFRSLDQRLCAVWPLGTHFMWHILNGVVLGVLLTGWLRHGARPVAASPAAR